MRGFAGGRTEGRLGPDWLAREPRSSGSSPPPAGLICIFKAAAPAFPRAAAAQRHPRGRLTGTGGAPLAAAPPQKREGAQPQESRPGTFPAARPRSGRTERLSGGSGRVSRATGLRIAPRKPPFQGLLRPPRGPRRPLGASRPAPPRPPLSRDGAAAALAGVRMGRGSSAGCGRGAQLPGRPQWPFPPRPAPAWGAPPWGPRREKAACPERLSWLASPADAGSLSGRPTRHRFATGPGRKAGRAS